MHALLIGGVASSVGKTTVTLGLMAALRRRGLRVQGFKVGPDFIDAGLRGRLAGAEIEQRPADSALSREAQYDRLADALETHLDVARILTLMGIE